MACKENLAVTGYHGLFVCMYVYICINFHDKIIVCAGSVDLKGIKNKSKKETKKIDYCLVKSLFSICTHIDLKQNLRLLVLKATARYLPEGRVSKTRVGLLLAPQYTRRHLFRDCESHSSDIVLGFILPRLSVLAVFIMCVYSSRSA